ncbi:MULTISPECIES: L-rhamnose mutarotase [unclassified Meridianimarinicoccus]|uniref:L-rhamnose mutarotase n=1 Tax=unclassified Meridianimarinicoccus TaxID=2923344 RepID=UPI0018676C7D|nr:L-rhamnose mutarotase [Fluviibacterium sp. MJW13]
MTLHRRAWTMRLKDGAEAAYDKAHAAVWPELLDQMTASGIRQFHLFRTGTTIFAFQERDRPFPAPGAPASETTTRWWNEMAQLMVTDADGRPEHYPLKPVFSLTLTESAE